MARSIKSNQNTGSSKIGQTPIPACGGTGAVVRRHKSVVGGTETPGIDDADGQPDHVEQEVEKDHGGGAVEDPSEVSRYSSLVMRQFTGLI